MPGTVRGASPAGSSSAGARQSASADRHADRAGEERNPTVFTVRFQGNSALVPRQLTLTANYG